MLVCPRETNKTMLSTALLCAVKSNNSRVDRLIEGENIKE